MGIFQNKKTILSGWATRDFTIEEFERYLANINPDFLEISKDFTERDISIKKIFEVVKKVKGIKISYAGTTDFVNCSNMEFEDYLNYLSIQASQAKFLGADFFRIMIGKGDIFCQKILERLNLFKELIKPVKILVEIHGGWESKLENLKEIVNRTNYNFVIDFQNILESNLSFEDLKEIIPGERVEYYHTRNLGSKYVEHKISLIEEEKWTCKIKKAILWEPKKINEKEILKYLNSESKFK